MIGEALPARRPFQKIIHAPLDVGACEDRTRPRAVHGHPHRHARVCEARVEEHRGHLGAGVGLRRRSRRGGKRPAAARGRLLRGGAERALRQLQVRGSLPACHAAGAPCAVRVAVVRVGHPRAFPAAPLPSFLPSLLLGFALLTFPEVVIRSLARAGTNVRPCASTFCPATEARGTEYISYERSRSPHARTVFLWPQKPSLTTLDSLGVRQP